MHVFPKVNYHGGNEQDNQDAVVNFRDNIRDNEMRLMDFLTTQYAADNYDCKLMGHRLGPPYDPMKTKLCIFFTIHDVEKAIAIYDRFGFRD